ncbi:Rieske (2Fe-2S) protein [uncultured Draconibacterium sp.]|uniref:QcrA and Rieske domain-containing protein n=1 Tax=uncultured Draconibacterium sp. TaxID=1573823 RepID=UPI0025E4DDA7|nr:Rieske (2Fe-2S) protein [uncultured Draconibacterium sp.]
MTTKNRRAFLKFATAGLLAFFVYIWNKLTLQHIKTSENKTSTLPLNKNKEVQFFDQYIVVNSEKGTTVFSSYCSHLGCKINKVENKKLVCPCHGSEYKLDGTVIKGPAYKDLKKVNYTTTADGKNIIVNG